MKKAIAITAALALLGVSMAASAAVTIDVVTVGDSGNTADTTGYGSVSYVYNIGRYEVTAGQYTDFLNAVAKTDTYGLYNTYMSNTLSGSGITRSGSSGSYTYTVDAAFVNRPVNWVSFWDACRFANWLHNGQPTGDQDLTTTEDGAYFLNGYTGGDGRWIQRKPGSSWVVTSENEWYKAAYYKGGGTNAGYWLYPTQSDTVPGRDLNDASGNNANYWGAPYPIQAPYYTTAAGEFQNSDSAYGTFDQGGNVWEWTEAVVSRGESYVARILRGGSFDGEGWYLHSSVRNEFYFPYDEASTIGFRVSAVVPEPSSAIALLGGLAGLIGVRRRKA